MSMLAEPRKKQKYSLNPRGLDWANDENKFGQKLMERMGWRKGNGLGANEDGNQECITVSAKHDSKGVGFTHQQSDNWLSHQDDFAAVLAQLHSQHSDSSTSAATSAAADDVSSLEEKSKSSRRRVHYKKFTQGKDLSNCQGEDLKCIFGRKKNKNKSAREDVRDESEQQQTMLQSAGQADSSENSFGVMTITSTSSIAEYFAKKMASLKKSCSAPSYLDQQGDDSMNESGMKGSGTVSDEEQPVSFCLGAEEPDESSTIDSKRKNKKSKKNKEEKEPQVSESSIDEPEKVERKRERKREREMKEETEEREKKNKQEKVEQIEDEDVIVCEPERKKSKKSKSSKSTSEHTHIAEVSGECADALNSKSETIVEVNDDIKIKKKKKNKSKVDVNNASNDSVIVCDETSDNITSSDDVIRVDDDVVKIDDADDNDVQNSESVKSDKKSKKRDKSKKKSKS